MAFINYSKYQWQRMQDQELNLSSGIRMIYIIANSHMEGKQWAVDHFENEEKYKVFSTPNEIQGRRFVRTDNLYLINNPKLMTVLYPALMGCKIYAT